MSTLICALSLSLSLSFFNLCVMCSLSCSVVSKKKIYLINAERENSYFYLANSFDELSYSHTRREGNQIVHGLAKYAKSIPDLVVWMEDVPPQLILFLQADLIGVH